MLPEADDSYLRHLPVETVAKIRNELLADFKSLGMDVGWMSNEQLREILLAEIRGPLGAILDLAKEVRVLDAVLGELIEMIDKIPGGTSIKWVAHLAVHLEKLNSSICNSGVLVDSLLSFVGQKVPPVSEWRQKLRDQRN